MGERKGFLLRLDPEVYDALQRWAATLHATAWDAIHVYFMHEPTAPAYARSLMAFSA